MIDQFDLIVIGSGPGGYVAAIRASQLGMNVAVIEKESLGGVCLNWGCIPTKALLKSAQVWEYIQKADDYGFKVGKSIIEFDKIIKRSRKVANDMSKGVDFLLKKNKITVIKGKGKLKTNNTIIVEESKGKFLEYKANHIIIATGARSRELPNLKIDNKKIIGYRKAMVLEKAPKNMVIVGAGAIGSEFAYFYNSIGTKVTLIEYMDNIVPLEDQDISKQLKKSFQKAGIDILTNTEVLNVDSSKKNCEVIYKTKDKKESKIKCDIVLSAVGISSNIEGIGLEELGIDTDKNKIKVDEYYKTNKQGIYAIGDIIAGPALAHVASAEGIICVEAISGLNPELLNYNNMPNCTYCQPEIASVGFTEKTAKEAGYEIKIGKFPFIASGKANAAGHKEGFIKVIFDAKYGEWLGAHMIGSNVTELIAEVVVARKLETTGHEIIKSTHPHPTLSEAIMEAVTCAYNECIHL